MKRWKSCSPRLRQGIRCRYLIVDCLLQGRSTRQPGTRHGCGWLLPRRESTQCEEYRQAASRKCSPLERTGSLRPVTVFMSKSGVHAEPTKKSRPRHMAPLRFVGRHPICTTHRGIDSGGRFQRRHLSVLRETGISSIRLNRMETVKDDSAVSGVPLADVRKRLRENKPFGTTEHNSASALGHGTASLPLA